MLRTWYLKLSAFLERAMLDHAYNCVSSIATIASLMVILVPT